MRPALRHVPARVAIALLTAGLIAGPAAAGSMAAEAGAGPGLPASCTWKLRVAPTPQGYSGFYATGARNRYLVGAGNGPHGLRALRWDNGTVAVLDAPGHDQAIAMDVNNRGVVVANDIDTSRAFLWNRGQVVKLARPRGATDTSAGAINDAGTIVGSAMIGDQRHGIIWSAQSPGSYRDLGTGDGWLELTDVSESGTIVGYTSLDEYGTVIALKGTATGGLSRILGLDHTKDSVAGHVAGAYIEGAGSRPGDTGQLSIRWQGDTAVIMPSEFRGFDVNSTGLVAGAVDKYIGGSIIDQVAVWDGETVTSLPSHQPDGFSSVGALTENGTVFGLSQATNDSMDSGLPVTWTCS